MQCNNGLRKLVTWHLKYLMGMIIKLSRETADDLSTLRIWSSWAVWIISRKWSTSSLRASSSSVTASKFKSEWLYFGTLHINGYQHWRRRFLEYHTPAKLKCLYRPSKVSALVENNGRCSSRHHGDPSEPYSKLYYGTIFLRVKIETNSYLNNFHWRSNKFCKWLFSSNDAINALMCSTSCWHSLRL